jgi:hypothetical protein
MDRIILTGQPDGPEGRSRPKQRRAPIRPAAPVSFRPTLLSWTCRIRNPVRLNQFLPRPAPWAREPTKDRR